VAVDCVFHSSISRTAANARKDGRCVVCNSSSMTRMCSTTQLRSCLVRHLKSIWILDNDTGFAALRRVPEEFRRDIAGSVCGPDPDLLELCGVAGLPVDSAHDSSVADEMCKKKLKKAPKNRSSKAKGESLPDDDIGDFPALAPHDGSLLPGRDSSHLVALAEHQNGGLAEKLILGGLAADPQVSSIIEEMDIPADQLKLVRAFENGWALSLFANDGDVAQCLVSARDFQNKFLLPSVTMPSEDELNELLILIPLPVRDAFDLKEVAGLVRESHWHSLALKSISILSFVERAAQSTVAPDNASSEVPY
jgi:hypothetical protein